MADRRVMVVTGASRGLGRAMVEHFVADDTIVVGCSRKEGDFQHANYRHRLLDVTDDAAVCDLMRDIRKEFQRLDCVINNAGIASMNHSLLTPTETFKTVVDVNLLGTFLFCREAAKVMQARRFGRIVNFTTPAVRLKLAGEAAYAAAKAGVTLLTEVLARELGGMGITVNAVGPSPIKTDLLRGVPEDKLRHLIDQQAIPRYGEPRDVINAVDFFLRPESDFITGQVLYLGGF